MCAPICAAPEDTVMTCDDCKMGVQARVPNKNTLTHRHKINISMQPQAAIDQLLSPESLDAIVDFLANGEFCTSSEDAERCQAAVDVVIRQGLPMLAAMGDDAAFAEVTF